MFGYLVPDKPYLYLKDDTLYKALYCGVCKSIGKVSGQRARFTLTYDIAFLSAIANYFNYIFLGYIISLFLFNTN